MTVALAEQAPDLAAAAVGYARRGLAVFPVWPALPGARGGFVCGCGRSSCTSPAKHPIPRLAPRGVNDATADAARVRWLWECRPNANIGCATGAVVVIDVDPRHGGSLEVLCGKVAAGEPLPSTWRVATGGGGEHLYFRAPPGVAISNSSGKLAPGIDVRGAGGYVILPPSRHKSGEYYRWQTGPPEQPLALLPAWLLAALHVGAHASNNNGKAANDWHQLVGADVMEGARNQTIARLAGHLLRHYVDPRVALELLLAWNATRCRPPLGGDEVARTVNSIAGKELRRRSGQ